MRSVYFFTDILHQRFEIWLLIFFIQLLVNLLLLLRIMFSYLLLNGIIYLNSVLSLIALCISQFIYLNFTSRFVSFIFLTGDQQHSLSLQNKVHAFIQQLLSTCYMQGIVLHSNRIFKLQYALASSWELVKSQMRSRSLHFNKYPRSC